MGGEDGVWWWCFLFCLVVWGVNGGLMMGLVGKRWGMRGWKMF